MKNKLNNNYDRVKEKSCEWVERFELLDVGSEREKFLKSDFSRLSALIFPDIKEEHLQFINDWMFWIFLFDDELENIKQFELAEKIKENVISIMENGKWKKTQHSYFDRLLDGYKDLITRWKEWTNKECHQRFIKHTENYLQAAIELAKHRQNKSSLSLKKYLFLRKHDIGSDTLSVFIEMAKNIPSQIFADERIKRIVEIATLNTIGINDIASLEKDRKKNEDNWIFLLEEENKIKESEAISEIRKTLKEGLEELENIYKELENDPDKKLFADNVKKWIAGNEEWHSNSGRYIESNKSNQEIQKAEVMFDKFTR